MDQRRDLILNAAHALIREKGFAALSMDLIAEQVQYSKGTIYQHFPCKEEVLIHLAMRGLIIWQDFFARALTFRGLPRERLLALNVAHRLYADLYPLEYHANYTVKVSGVRERIAPATHTAHEAMLLANIHMVAEVIDDAVARGDLTLPAKTMAHDLIYTFWAAHYGHLTLRSYGLPLERMGIGSGEDNGRLLFRALVDGLGWRPLSSEHDYAAAAECIAREIFAAEMHVLAAPQAK